jgi:phosphatidylserine decarboxylase
MVTTSFAPGAFWQAGLLVLAALPATVAFPPAGAGLLALAGGVLYFYRDPERSPPPGGLVAPADGVVSVLRWDEEYPDRVRLGVYLSLTDVHVIRAPAGGQVHDVTRESGGHWPATLQRAEKNERVHVHFDGLRVTMLTGAVARRITPAVSAGDRVRRGERVGHIAFGSRTDVLLPRGVGPEDVDVEPGERVRAGETVLVGHDAFDGDRETAPVVETDSRAE